MARITLSDNGVVGPTAGRAESQACGGLVRPTLTGRQRPVKQEPKVVRRSSTDRNSLPSGRGGRQMGEGSGSGGAGSGSGFGGPGDGGGGEGRGVGPGDGGVGTGAGKGPGSGTSGPGVGGVTGSGKGCVIDSSWGGRRPAALRRGASRSLPLSPGTRAHARRVHTPPRPALSPRYGRGVRRECPGRSSSGSPRTGRRSPRGGATPWPFPPGRGSRRGRRTARSRRAAARPG